MFALEVKEGVDRTFRRMAKKDRTRLESVEMKVAEILPPHALDRDRDVRLRVVQLAPEAAVGPALPHEPRSLDLSRNVDDSFSFDAVPCLPKNRHVIPPARAPGPGRSASGPRRRRLQARYQAHPRCRRRNGHRGVSGGTGRSAESPLSPTRPEPPRP